MSKRQLLSTGGQLGAQERYWESYKSESDWSSSSTLKSIWSFSCLKEFSILEYWGSVRCPGKVLRVLKVWIWLIFNLYFELNLIVFISKDFSILKYWGSPRKGNENLKCLNLIDFQILIWTPLDCLMLIIYLIFWFWKWIYLLSQKS